MEAAMITLRLPTDLYEALQSLASAEQVEPVEMIARLVMMAEGQRTPPEAPTRAFQNILERATDLGVEDLSEQHDHYLYGVEKQ
jgi:hypothetical protein